MRLYGLCQFLNYLDVQVPRWPVFRRAFIWERESWEAFSIAPTAFNGGISGDFNRLSIYPHSTHGVTTKMVGVCALNLSYTVSLRRASAHTHAHTHLV